jgi:glycosyltransferase involved in cell wall biosynthesis
MYGAEAVVASLARMLPSLGVETCIGHMRYAGSPAIFRLEEHLPGVAVVPLEHYGRVDPGLVLRLCAAMKKLGIDAIHSHGYKPDVYGGAAAHLMRLPALSTCHLWTRATRALRAYAKLDALALRSFDNVIAVSKPIFDDLRAAGIGKDRVSLIPNGICADNFAAGSPSFRSRSDANAIVFGAACRQVGAKGIDLLLHAVVEVTARVPPARFLVAGDGPMLEEYRNLAQNLGIARKVEFLGRCNNMPDFYASLDAFVLPSLDEGLPIALLEAMAATLPVIATSVGSVDQVIRNRHNGFLIPPGDIPALVNAMVALASDRELRLRLGEAARSEVLLRHTDKQMAQRYADLYQAVGGQ